MGICFLKKHLDKNEKINTVLEIGGGFGTLGEILSFTETSNILILISHQLVLYRELFKKYISKKTLILL